MSAPSPCTHFSNSSTALLLLILVSAVTFLCHHHAVALGFDPLIQLPIHGRGSDDDDSDGDNRGLGDKKFFSVKDYGAKGNGISDDTKAFKYAWRAACASTSRKTVLYIPEDHKYLVRPINFAGPCSSNVTLRIRGSIHAHPSTFFWHKQNPERWLCFHGVTNLALRGKGIGIINGMGKKWWSKPCKSSSNGKKLCQPSTAAITFRSCRYLKVRNMTLANSPGTHLAFINCYHVKASGLKVIAPEDGPRNDGILIDGSRTVYVQNSRITTGDNCISVATGSSKVRIRNVACAFGHGISIGSLGKENAWAKVNDVLVDGAFLSNTKSGLWIKTWQGGQGSASELSFQNVMMDNVSNPIVIDQYYCDSLQTCRNDTSAVKLSKVSFTNIMGTSATEKAVTFSCSDSVPCRNILLRDVQLTMASGGNATSYCWKASGFSYGLVDPPSCLATEDDYPIMQKVPLSTALLSSAR